MNFQNKPAKGFEGLLQDRDSFAADRADNNIIDLPIFILNWCFGYWRTIAKLFAAGILFGTGYAAFNKTENTVVYTVSPPITEHFREAFSAISNDSWQQLVPLEARFANPAPTGKSQNIDSAFTFPVFLLKLENQVGNYNDALSSSAASLSLTIDKPKTNSLWTVSLMGKDNPETLTKKADELFKKASNETIRLVEKTIQEQLVITIQTIQAELELRNKTAALLTSQGKIYQNPELAAITAQLEYFHGLQQSTFDFPTYILINQKTEKGSTLLKLILGGFAGFLIMMISIMMWVISSFLPIIIRQKQTKLTNT